MIKIGLLQEAKNVREIMFENFGESCDKINRKILKFVRENLCKNKNYFDSLDFNNDENSLNTTENEDENETKKNKKKTTENEEKINKIQKKSLKMNKIIFKEICNKINEKLNLEKKKTKFLIFH